MSLPRVLIISPTYSGKEYCRKEWVKSIQSLTYPKEYVDFIMIDNTEGLEYTEVLKADGVPVIHIARGNNSRESLARAQNKALELAKEGNYDYMLSIESDVFPPKDAIQELIGSGKKVIGSYYEIGFEEQGTRIPCIFLDDLKPNGLRGTRLLTFKEAEDIKNVGIIRIHGCGMGCTLIHKDLFNVTFYYDIRYPDKHSDVYYFAELKKLGVPAYVNTDVICEHMNSDWSKVEDR